MKKFIALCLACVLVFTGCGSKDEDSSETTAAASVLVTAPERTEYPDNSNSEIPQDYFKEVKDCGGLWNNGYMGKDFSGSNNEIVKDVTMYLPFDYEENGTKKYNILYIITNENENQDTYFPDGQKSAFKIMLDNMIAKGDIEPCIVCVISYFNVYVSDEAKGAEAFYKEFTKKTIPSIEKEFRTYYDPKSKTAIKDSRYHRAVAGYGFGGLATWYIFANAIESAAYYMPISADCHDLVTNTKNTKSTDTVVGLLERAIKKQGFNGDSFKIFAGNGGSSDDAAAGLATQIEDMKKNELFKETTNFGSGNLFNCTCDTGKTPDTLYKVIYNGLKTFFDK